MTTRRTTPARQAALVLAGVMVTCLPQRAYADAASEVEAARTLFVEAASLARLGRWGEARERYARSLRLKPAAITHYALGVVEVETGQLAAALHDFQAFLAEPPTAATAAYVEPARAAAATLERRVGRVVVTTNPATPSTGLQLTLDGQPVPAVVGTPWEVDPGTHEVGACAPGFGAGGARVTAKPGITVSIVVTMRLGASGAPLEPCGATPGDSPLPAPGPFAPGPVAEAGRKAVPIALLVSGGALFALGVTLGLLGVSQASGAPTRDGADAHSARAKALAGDVLGAAGLAAVGVGVVLVLTHRRPLLPAAGAATTFFAPVQVAF